MPGGHLLQLMSQPTYAARQGKENERRILRQPVSPGHRSQRKVDVGPLADPLLHGVSHGGVLVGQLEMLQQ